MLNTAIRVSSLFLSSAIVLALSSANAFAGNSDLDASFNGGGIMYRQLSTLPYDSAGACAIESSGKLLVAGGTAVANYNDRNFGTIRHNYDGTPDFTFGDGTGKIVTSINPYADQERGMVMLPGGGFVTAGYTVVNGAYNQIGLAKYTASGQLDTTFGGGTGKVTSSLGAYGSNAASVALQWDGKYVVAGTINDSTTNTDFLVVRYNADGTLDSTFGVGGKRQIPISAAGRDNAYGVSIQDDGGIVVVGDYPVGNDSGLAVVRLTSQGNLDATFGTGGIATLARTGLRIAGRAIAVQPDKKIVVTANSLIPTNGSYMGLVARFNANGTLDTTFAGGNGYFQNGFGGSQPEITSIELLPTGQILMGGRTFISAQNIYLFLVARYTAAGALDTSYNGGAGWKIGDIASSASQSISQVSSLAVLPTGQFYACGFSGNKFAVARYQGDALDTYPTPFNFPSKSGVAPSSIQLSDVVTISGLTPGAKVPMQITAGSTYSINGGTEASGLGWVQNGDQVFVKHTAAATRSTPTTTYIVLGGLRSANNTPNILGSRVWAAFTSTTQ